MIKITNIDTWGFEHAVRGMRNPLNSWDKSDSTFEPLKIGDRDFSLMKRLFDAGTEHRKYLRQIMVSMDITAPFYWWKEMSTYKVGTVANSCSTMHKFLADEFTEEDFSIDDAEIRKHMVDGFNDFRNLYLKITDKEEKKDLWRAGIQTLPCGYNQMRTVTMNYENVVNIIKQRKGHKLSEWHDFIDVLMGLPMIKELMDGTDI